MRHVKLNINVNIDTFLILDLLFLAQLLFLLCSSETFF